MKRVRVLSVLMLIMAFIAVSDGKALGYANLLCDDDGCSVGFADTCGWASNIIDNSISASKLANGAVTVSKLGFVCPDGLFLRYTSAGGWGCGAANGDITSVIAGTGLTGGATSGDATLNVNFAGNGAAGTASRSDHNHDATYIEEGQLNSVTTTMIINGAVTDAKITGPISAAKINSAGLNADTLDGIDSTGFAASVHDHDAAYVNAAGDTMTGPLVMDNTQAAITVNPFGLVAGETGEVRFQELTANGINYVGLKAPDIIGADQIWTLPASDGIAGQVLTTSGAGILGWSTPSGGSVTSVGTGTGLTGGPITTTGTISLADTSVAAGSYTRANITVDAQGRLTSASSGGSVNLATDVTGILPIANGGTGSNIQNFVDLSTAQSVGGAKTFTSIITGDISGNAGTVTNGVYTTGSYANPAWITSLAGSKITGDISVDNLSLPATTLTIGQIKLDGNRFVHAFGTANTFIGKNAGNLIMTGNDNTASGINSLLANTTGYYNTASGSGSMAFNTTGFQNTASGVSSLLVNTTGDGNTASGFQSLASNTTGQGNTALGYNAGYNQTTGSNNIYIGNNVTGAAGESNITRIGNGQTQAIIAGTVTATGFVGSGAGLTGVTASTVTDGVYTTGSYADPAWITSLAGSKITGNISGNAANVTGVVAIANGGTGATTAGGALTNLGAAASGANSDITSLSGLTTPLSISQGGTGSSTQNFVDLTTAQTVGGAKTFSSDLALSSNLLLPATTGTTGQIKLGGTRFAHNYGSFNAFVGSGAGNLTMTGVYNTASGFQSLSSNTTGSNNAAIGAVSLLSNTTGNYNTASGVSSLRFNTTGSNNTANGTNSLGTNTTGSQNTAIGTEALMSLSFNNGGTAWNSDNTATGFRALYSNLPSSISTGIQNTAVGSQSLYTNTTGNYNTALGYLAGSNQTTGSNNIYIGHNVAGVAGESNVTRIGNGQTQAIIAGTVTATGFVGSGVGLTGVTATTVTDGVYTTGSYADPAWITSLAGSKVSGNISGNAANVTGVVAIANGGTGANNAATALTNLGAAASGANSDITSLSGLTTPLSISQGGTGSNTQNFVDLSTTQTVGGAKTFSEDITGLKNILLPATTATTGQIKLGGNLFAHNYGTQNTFIGENAGNFSMTGAGNTASGAASLTSTTTGTNNTASGVSSLVSNDAGDGNTASGAASLFSNTTGNNNTASGVSSLVSNTTGNSNTALGVYAGLNQTTGSNNIYVGYDVQGVAGESNVTRIGNGQTQAIIAGTVTATGFVGDGSGLTGVTGTPTAHVHSGADITSGTVGETYIDSAIARDTEVSSAISTHTANASAHHTRYTDAEAVAAILAADGSGSTLNADLLDGMDSTAFAVAAHDHNADYINVTGDTMSGTLNVTQSAASGEAGNFVISNATSSAHALHAETNGPGIAVHGTVTGTGGSAGVFQTTGAANVSATLTASTAGTGLAGSFTTTNTTNANPTIFAQTAGTGEAGKFQIFNAASTSHALHAETNGTGYALHAISTNATPLAGFFDGAVSINGSLTFPVTSLTAGQIKLGGVRFIHAYGTDNTFIGLNAGNLSMTGNYNTASGANSLFSNITGINNTANGVQSLRANTGGSHNTATGFQSLYSNISGTQNTAIGYGSLFANTSGVDNTASGVGSLASNTTGFRNAALGQSSGNANTIGSNNTFVGYFADAAANNLGNATAIGNGAIVDASNHVRIGDTAVTQIGGQVAWSNLSDIRTKNDVQDIGLGLDFINSLRPVEFTMKQGNNRIDFGFVAQDIEAALGLNYNILGIGGDPARTLSLRYTDFIAPMVKAMQEQQSIIVAQKDRISELEARLTRLEALISVR